MPAYTLRLDADTTRPVPDDTTAFWWPAGAGGSFVSTLGPSLGALGPVPEPNIELVRLATLVYAADRTAPRRAARSNWTQRAFELDVPVYDVARWTAVRERLEALLAFLSGDQWSIRFHTAGAPHETICDTPHPGIRRVVLLSGGADSAVGALHSRHDLAPEQHLLLSHVGATTLAPIQRTVADTIAHLIDGPPQPHQALRFSRKSHQPTGTKLPNEYSTRTRSLLFLALGLAAAAVEKVPLWIPENGFASLNVPLTADQRGAVSTRTTHPLFLQTLAAIAHDAGAHAHVHNPFAAHTKGEMFTRAAELVGPAAATRLLSNTHSCAHTGHRTHRIPVRTHCGVCFGCLLRRASFRAAQIEDTTDYLHTRHAENLSAYLTGKSVEPSLRTFLARGLRPADITTLNLPSDYSTRQAYDLCRRGVAELELLYP
ncbi:7-cyano-7-deazaguanine synthase [Streptomyces sp. NPDC005752]|uniref:7-cyano-7-deazaguanine synthase n=1 Tax=Streptomyces sp. NPDC005752 TaxID=3157065 RepID=UPI0033C16593